MSEKGVPSLLERHWAESALAIGAVIIAAVSLWVAVTAGDFGSSVARRPPPREPLEPRGDERPQTRLQGGDIGRAA
ncbi:MAG: hypothetical protein WBW93_11110, partial [Steroidobacteraceae bacterium]